MFYPDRQLVKSEINTANIGLLGSKSESLDILLSQGGSECSYLIQRKKIIKMVYQDRQLVTPGENQI